MAVPAAALIAAGIGLVGSLIGSANARRTAALAEMKTEDKADIMRQWAEQYLKDLKNNTSLRSMTKSALGQAGGAIAGSGLLGSSIGNSAMLGVLSDVLAKTYPSRMQSLGNAYQMMMAPEQMMADFYARGAEAAAGSSSMDLSGLGQLLLLMGGGG